MPEDLLNEREFELINIIGPKLDANQRELSRQMNLSLGMINMLIRRLIIKGLIRTHQLNKKKVQYIITPKGFSEKMRKSIKYTLKTINSIGIIKNRLKIILSDLVEKGERNFVILGESDLAILVELVLKDMDEEGHYTVACVAEIPQEGYQGILLVCKENYQPISENNHKNSINLIEELARDQVILGDSLH